MSLGEVPTARRSWRSHRAHASEKFFKRWKMSPVRLPSMLLVGLSRLLCSCMKKHRQTGESSPQDVELPQVLSCPWTASEPSTSGEQPAYEFLESPELAAIDGKSYRVIRLIDGVTATVISNGKGDVDNDGQLKSFTDEMRWLSSHYERAEMKWLERDVSKIEEPQPNDESLSACAVTVKVGSFDDPEDIPGLCHLLEHVVSMGSAKYPSETAFVDLLEEAGGAYNAETDCDYTTFYFQCKDDYFIQCLDMFSQFFKSPLLQRLSIYKEIRAVNSEFEGILNNDNARRMQLICGCAKEENPARKFSWGNFQTLKFGVKISRLVQALSNLRKIHFVAENIHVAVLSSRSTEEMIELVNIFFSDLPTTKPEIKIPISGCPFDMSDFSRVYIVQSVADICELNLNWAFWPMSAKYKTKPLDYLSYVIAAEGEGSLISFLRDEDLALLSSAEVEKGSLVSNSVYTIFTVCFSLTEKGYKNYLDVVKFFFGYVKMLKDFGPSPKIFKELKKITKLNCLAAQSAEAIDVVKILSRNMTTFPSSDYLTGWALFFDYCPSDINACLNVLSPSNVNVLLHAKRHNRVLDREEPWFKTRYRVEDISLDVLHEWENVEHLKLLFRPPKRNPYIAGKFDLVSPVNSPKPALLEETALYEIWHKGDSSFRIPFITVDILISPTIDKDRLQNTMCQMLFVKLLKYQIIEDLYFARVAFIEQHIAAVEQGLEISIFGLSDKLPLVLDAVASGILQFEKKLRKLKRLFDNLKDSVKKNMISTLSDGSLLLEEFRKSLLTTTSFHCGDKYECLRRITVEHLQEFWESLFGDVHIAALVQGNITDDGALQMVKEFIFVLNANSSLGRRPVQSATCDVPEGETLVAIKAFHPKDDNCYTQFYIQFGRGDERESVALQLFVALIGGHLSDKINVEEQLGYKVSSHVSEIQNVLGVVVTIYSKRDQHSPDDVRTRVSALIFRCLDFMSKLPNQEFLKTKKHLLARKSRKPHLLKQESQLSWWEIKTQRYKFEATEMEISALKSLDKNFLLETVRRLLSKSAKTLVVQIVGFTEAERDDLRRSNYRSLSSIVNGNSVTYGYASKAIQSLACGEKFTQFRLKSLKSGQSDGVCHEKSNLKNKEN